MSQQPGSRSAGHQGIDEWAQRGLVESAGRNSADQIDEAVVPQPVAELPESVAPTPGVLSSSEPEPEPEPEPRPESAPAAAAAPDLDGGEPGTAGNAGSRAEQAAFQGDAAYSEGRFGTIDGTA